MGCGDVVVILGSIGYRMTERIPGQQVRSLLMPLAFSPEFFLQTRCLKEVHFLRELKSLSLIATSDMSKVLIFVQYEAMCEMH